MSINDKGTILTYTGKGFNILQPRSDMFDIQDIAHSLSMQCRYTGHCRLFYSVAQHSVYVSYQVPEGIALAALLHDAAEAYTGDVSSPLKALLPNYSALEDRVQEYIYVKYLPYSLGTYARCQIKQADLELLVCEKRDLLPESEPWGSLEGVRCLNDLIIHPHFSPELAKEEFLARFQELTANTTH